MKWKFSPNDKEWHQTLINAFENILGLKVKPVLVYDRKHFNNYTYGPSNSPNSVWAECIKESGLIWISPHLASEPKVETINTLYHECLHIKFPKLHERKIRKLADDMIPTSPSMSSKKKKFDIVHRR